MAKGKATYPEEYGPPTPPGLVERGLRRQRSRRMVLIVKDNPREQFYFQYNPTEINDSLTSDWSWEGEKYKIPAWKGLGGREISFTLFLNEFGEPPDRIPKAVFSTPGNSPSYTARKGVEACLDWLREHQRPRLTGFKAGAETVAKGAEPPLLVFLSAKGAGKIIECVLKDVKIKKKILDPVTHETLRAEVGITLLEFKMYAEA